jgi:predicted DCC family thiol-disulfide oxidoreductase YuxK
MDILQENIVKQIHEGKSIILFDGICNFCNSSVNFIIDRDGNDNFRFASIQSDEGNTLIKNLGVDILKNDSIILIEGGKYYLHSSAALRITKKLSGFWKLGYIFVIIPPFIRDFFYKIIAKNRYKWFGRKEACRIPAPEERAKFL